MNIEVEVFFVSPLSDRLAAYIRAARCISDAVGDPDSTAHEIKHALTADGTLNNVESFYLHSTSWRFDNEDIIFLTYMAFADSFIADETSAGLLNIIETEAPESSSADRPRPMHIAERHVVLHGLRHLSYLISHGSDNVIRSVIGPAGSRLLLNMTPYTAGKLSTGMIA